MIFSSRYTSTRLRGHASCDLHSNNLRALIESLLWISVLAKIILSFLFYCGYNNKLLFGWMSFHARQVYRFWRTLYDADICFKRWLTFFLYLLLLGLTRINFFQNKAWPRPTWNTPKSQKKIRSKKLLYCVSCQVKRIVLECVKQGKKEVLRYVSLVNQISYSGREIGRGFGREKKEKEAGEEEGEEEENSSGVWPRHSRVSRGCKWPGAGIQKLNEKEAVLVSCWQEAALIAHRLGKVFRFSRRLRSRRRIRKRAFGSAFRGGRRENKC